MWWEGHGHEEIIGKEEEKKYFLDHIYLLSLLLILQHIEYRVGEWEWKWAWKEIIDLF